MGEADGSETRLAAALLQLPETVAESKASKDAKMLQTGQLMNGGSHGWVQAR